MALPEARNPYLRVLWDGEAAGEVIIGLNGDILQHRQTGGGQWLYLLHYRLHYLPTTVALNLLMNQAAQQWGQNSTRLITVSNPNDASSISRLIRMIGPEVAPSV